MLLAALLCAATGARAGGIANSDFECGDLRGWKADPNWAVDDNSAGGWYSGWEGRRFAWSGKGGEPATGKLRSAPFVLDRGGVEVWLAGWADLWGRTADRWNYVTLNLEGGKELDRIYAPNSVTFTPVILDGGGHRGRRVYLEAVDDAPQPSFSMLCIDRVRTVDVPAASAPLLFDSRKSLCLESRALRVEVSRANGSITRIRDKVGGLELIREPRLADSFRLSLPLRGKESWQATEGNYVLGRGQRLTSFRQTANALELHWRGPLRSEMGKLYPVWVTLRISLAGEAARFGLTVRNRSRCELGEVYYPVLGGLLGLGDRAHERKRTEMVLPAGAGLQTSLPFHTFGNMSPFGTLYPEQFYAYPTTLSMPWLELQDRRSGRGVSLAVHDPLYRYKVLHLEMVPGLAGPRAQGNWPRPEELRGMPAGVRVCCVHFPYHPPGQTFEAAPVELRFHKGGWRQAARLYASWQRTVTRAAEPGRDWLPEEPALQECRSVPFRDLPRWAREAQDFGVGALLLSGWEAGGDDGIPTFEPDPRLGGPGELAEGIRQCHALGMRVVLQVSLGMVSQESEWYRREGHRYTCIDRWGVPFSELVGNGERRVWINPGAPGFRDAFREQIAALARLGADGVHLQGFSAAWLDFNPELRRSGPSRPVLFAGMGSPDRAAWEGALITMRETLQACRHANSAFCLSTDEARDRVLSLAPVAQVAASEPSALRCAFPSWRPMLPVTRGDEYAVVSDALRLGAVVRLAPRGGTVSLGDRSVRELALYLREVLRIREALKETLVEGECLGTEGASVEGNVAWGLFRSRRTGAPACVLTNPTAQPVQATVAQLAGKGGSVTVYRPFAEPRSASLPLTVEVPAGRVVVVASGAR